MGQKQSSSTPSAEKTTKSNQKEEQTLIIDDEFSYPIITLGDSITKGYYFRGRKFHPYAVTLNELISKSNTKCYELGWSGETTEKMKDRLKRMIDKNPNLDDQLVHFIGDEYDNIPDSDRGPMHLPKIGFKGAIIIGGTNDLAYGISSEMIANNLIEMYEYCFSKNVEWVVACSIPSSQYDADDSPSILKVMEKKAKVNELLKEYVQTQHEKLGRKILFVDFMTELNYSTCSEEDKQLWDDSLHYKPSGSDRIAEILFKHLTESGWMHE